MRTAAPTMPIEGGVVVEDSDRGFMLFCRLARGMVVLALADPIAGLGSGLDVRIRTRPERPRAQADARAANEGRTCPFLHTLPHGVCEVGHDEADSGGRASVCAHAASWRVQSRTRDRPFRALPVRLCTPSNAPCAQSDTTTGEGPGRPRVREGSTADGSAQ